MRILTLWQPWATFISLGIKSYETRSWGTTYRGPLLIHAAKRPMGYDEKYLLSEVLELSGLPANRCPFPEQLPLGKVVAHTNLVNVHQTRDCQVSELEKEVGGWAPGRFAWELNLINELMPIDFRGGQGLRRAPQLLIEQVLDQLPQ